MPPSDSDCVLNVDDSNWCECGCGQVTNRARDGSPRRYILGHSRRGKASPEGWVAQGQRFVLLDGKVRPLHRVIVEQREGRPLRSDEIVRHLDGDPLNNDPANLLLVSRAEHFQLSMTATSKRPWTHAEVERALALYESGMTVSEVAQALGRSYYATRRQLRKWLFLGRPKAEPAGRAS